MDRGNPSPGTPRASRRIPRSIRVLRHRDFALVQAGNSISSIGNWMQYVAIGWAIRQLTAWPFAVALGFVAQFGPSLLLSSFGGSLADRYDRRRLVILGNLVMVLPPVAMGMLVTLHLQTVPSLLAIAALGGAAQALSMPAMLAVVPRIVPEAEITEAIASSAVLQHLSRLIGPSFGALAIALWGVGSAFYLNASSFLAVVAAWCLVHPPRELKTPRTASSWSEIRDGLDVARRDVRLRLLLGFTLVFSLLSIHAALLPVLVKDVLHSGASGYGLLAAAPGVGAIVGTVLAGEIVTDRRRRIALVGSALAIGVAYTFVAFSRSLTLTACILTVWGFAFFLGNAVTQSVLLHATRDEYRGRVMGLYTTMNVGGSPIAALTGGTLASAVGAPDAVGLAACGLLAYGTWFAGSRAYRQIGIDDLLTRDLVAPEGAP